MAEEMVSRFYMFNFLKQLVRAIVNVIIKVQNA